MTTQLIVMDGSDATLNRDFGSELQVLTANRQEIALSLLCYVRDHQVGQLFEQHLYQISGMGVEQLIDRKGADSRIRERIDSGDLLVRARYVFQLIYRFYAYGLKEMLEHDSHVMCTVALGGGDKYHFQQGAEDLRALMMSSPRLAEILGLPKLLEQQRETPEDADQCFRFLYDPWYTKLWRLITG